MKLPLKKERVFRVTIEEDRFTFQYVRDKTGLSKSYVSKTLTDLAEKNVLLKHNGRYRLLKREPLLKEWVATKKRILETMKPLKLFVFMKERVKKLVEDCVISGTFAEHLVNGQTDGESVLVYATEDKIKDEAVSEHLSKKPNVFVYPYDDHITYHSWKTKGWEVVSIPQLCTDLIAQGIYADVGWDLFQRWLNADRRPHL